MELTIEGDIQFLDVGRVAEDDTELEMRFCVFGGVGFWFLESAEETLLLYFLDCCGDLAREQRIWMRNVPVAESIVKGDEHVCH